MTDPEEFRAYMKAANPTMGDRDANGENGHLSETEMLAFYRGEMPEVEHETAEAHLVACERCIALFRSAGDFLEPARTEEDVTAAETNEQWRSLLQRVPAIPANATVTTVAPGDLQLRRESKLFRGSRLTLALAASLLISCGALGWIAWSFRQEQQQRRQAQAAALQLESKQHELEQRLSQVEQSGGDELKREREQRVAAEAKRDQLLAQLNDQPGAKNIPVYSLRLGSERGTGDDLQLKFSSTAPAAWLLLLITKPNEFHEYAVELVDQHGEVVRQISGLLKTGDDGALSLRLDRAGLSTGKYKLRLFGGKTKKQLGEYGLTVTVR